MHSFPKAASAAYTYLAAHPSDSKMENNVKYYIDMPEVDVNEIYYGAKYNYFTVTCIAIKMDGDYSDDKINIKTLLFTKAIPSYTLPIAQGHKVFSCTDCGDRYIMESSYDYHGTAISDVRSEGEREYITQTLTK
ncbi:unnamed protein product, partial [Iphiclides podalirius]